MLEWLDRTTIKVTTAVANNLLITSLLFAVLLLVVLCSPDGEEEWL